MRPCVFPKAILNQKHYPKKNVKMTHAVAFIGTTVTIDLTSTERLIRFFPPKFNFINNDSEFDAQSSNLRA